MRSPGVTSIQLSSCSMVLSRIEASTWGRCVPDFKPRATLAPRSALSTYQHSVFPQGREALAAAWSSGCTWTDSLSFGKMIFISSGKRRSRAALMKIIFPKDKLSVQVHPDDHAAARASLPCGKTECWYVLSAERGARVALGLKSGTRRPQVEASIRDNTMEQLLNWIEVTPGDLIYVDAGTIHAIGPGCVLLETQQNSDTTYRLYDYGRPRELHIERGLEAMKEVTRAGKVKSRGGNGRVVLVSSPCFEVDKMLLKQEKAFSTAADPQLSSAHCIVGLRGCGIIECDSAPAISVGRGEAAVIPASLRDYRIRPQWEFECVRAMLPGETVGEPETVPKPST